MVAILAVLNIGTGFSCCVLKNDKIFFTLIYDRTRME